MGNTTSRSSLAEGAAQPSFIRPGKSVCNDCLFLALITTFDPTSKDPEWNPTPGVLEQATLSLQKFTTWIEDEAKTPGGGLSSLIIHRVEHRRSRRKPFNHQYVVLFVKYNSDEFVIRLDRMGKLGKLQGTWLQPSMTSRIAIDTVRIVKVADESAKTVIEDPAGSTLMKGYRLLITSGLDPALVTQYQREATLTLQEKLLPIFYSLPNPPEIPPVLIDHMNTHHGYTSPLGYHDPTTDPRIMYLVASAARCSQACTFTHFPYGTHLQYITDRERIYKGAKRRLGNAFTQFLWDEWRLERVWDFIYLPPGKANLVMGILKQVQHQLDLQIDGLSSSSNIRNAPLSTPPSTAHGRFKPTSLADVSQISQEILNQWSHYSLATTNCVLFSRTLLSEPRLWNFYTPDAAPLAHTFDTLFRYFVLLRSLVICLELVVGMLGAIIAPFKQQQNVAMVLGALCNTEMAIWACQSLFHSHPMSTFAITLFFAAGSLTTVTIFGVCFTYVHWAIRFRDGVRRLQILHREYKLAPPRSKKERFLSYVMYLLMGVPDRPLAIKSMSTFSLLKMLAALPFIIACRLLVTSQRQQTESTSKLSTQVTTGHNNNIPTSPHRDVAFYCQICAQWLNYFLLTIPPTYVLLAFTFRHEGRLPHRGQRLYLAVGGSVLNVFILVHLFVFPAIIRQGLKKRRARELELERRGTPSRFGDSNIMFAPPAAVQARGSRPMSAPIRTSIGTTSSQVTPLVDQDNV